MPKVKSEGKNSGMRYPYTKKGMEEATKYAVSTGKSIEIEGYEGGGRVPKYQYGGAVPRRPMMRPQGRRPIARPMPRLRPPGVVPRGMGLRGAGGRGRGLNPLAALLARLKGRG